MSKDSLRQQIAEQTKEFLDEGGDIEKVPRITFCPASMDWARKRGQDFMPWTLHGDQDFFAGKDFLGDGCYMTKPAKEEE